jgi:hypothetical protein
MILLSRVQSSKHPRKERKAMMNNIQGPGFSEARAKGAQWQDTYRQLKEKGKILDADSRSSFICSKKDGLVGVEFEVGGPQERDVKMGDCVRMFVPENGVDGTRVNDDGEEKKVYFFKVNAPYIPNGAQAHVGFDIFAGKEKVETRDLKVTIKDEPRE